jgi:hypothetical protein
MSTGRVHELGGDDLPRLPVDGDQGIRGREGRRPDVLIVDNIGVDF